jgi:hypothetical protein
MIRDAVVHMLNEQPLLADLRDAPVATDAAIICTNLRRADGKPILFVDHPDSWFVIPLGQVRFVEIPVRSMNAGERLSGAEADGDTSTSGEADLDFDEDLLRRIRES